PNRREANFSVVPRSLGRATVIGPLVVLTVVGPHHCLFRIAAVAGDGGGGGALVAGAAEERVHLGFDGGLDDQAGTEPGDVLDQITIGGEQGVDLGTDGLDRRYSTGHERGTSFVQNLAVQYGTYARDLFTPHPGRDLCGMIDHRHDRSCLVP
ncbi:hypothetical protein, partial [Nonomuraea sp. NPDC005650]|uniref:hypothetical protein n=1 Tax=Nonomuraea sp. NPDC005650 TaxID=3157045 RepID=UPI00339E3FD6